MTTTTTTTAKPIETEPATTAKPVETKPVTTAATTEEVKPTTTVVNPTDEPSSGEITNLKYGDVNLDGEISIVDAVLLNKYLVNGASLTDQSVANADCYKDGKPNANDTLTILKVIVGTYSESELPVIPA